MRGALSLALALVLLKIFFPEFIEAIIDLLMTLVESTRNFLDAGFGGVPALP